MEDLKAILTTIKNSLSGEFYFDELYKTIYATDASVFQETPLAVAIPQNKKDIIRLIRFANQYKFALIPRAGGTSLAGQCVGNGIIVDISKYFNKIIDFNIEENWVKVQPGVVRDDLNRFLEPYGYFFSPITSTANRATIGGMVGNNSSGTTSIVYGTTREHVIALEAILSDCSISTFKSISNEEFEEKCNLQNLEGEIYRSIATELENSTIQKEIIREFPKKSIHRRNTGYAVDYLLESARFSNNDIPFNFCKLLAGSEGTLAFTTAITLHIDKLPDPHPIIIAAHFPSILDSMRATQFAMKHKPFACELMDKNILDCTKDNLKQKKNRFFVEGDPEALLLIECRGKTIQEAETKANIIIEDLRRYNLGYAFPLIDADNNKKVWELRSAGLGLLSNIKGDKKATTCIEDTAVAIDDLENYIAEFEILLAKFGQKSVYYAHAGAGEIHLRPILNLKKETDIKQFREIALASAKLVKKYQGSLSGEHGDGRLRAEFIPLMVGENNYQLFRRIKSTWDPENIFNPGKIVDAPAMNTSLRYKSGMLTPEHQTMLSFDATGGMLRMAEKCTGSGDCRKSAKADGTMCPSYQVTKNEIDTTRGRANVLRKFLTNETELSAFNHTEIITALDLCISCKGCTSECPSNVDMSNLKAEALYQYYQFNRTPLRNKIFGKIDKWNALGSVSPSFTNFLLSNKHTSKVLKKALNIAPKRTLPMLTKTTLRKWFKRNVNRLAREFKTQKSVYLFVDEFTNRNDTAIGIKTIELLFHLGYKVMLTNHQESGRAAISKGLLKYAKNLAEKNTMIFKELIGPETPLVGIEPSAILTFRDEYPKLVQDKLKPIAKTIASNTFLIDEFLADEVKKGSITSKSFKPFPSSIHLHGHCHQKALSDLSCTETILKLVPQVTLKTIPSGCCGMAGSFGYEKEHYQMSMRIGATTLFPYIGVLDIDETIIANGTSCRHQIHDGTQRNAIHAIEFLHAALIN